MQIDLLIDLDVKIEMLKNDDLVRVFAQKK
jgi:hypothetical protein